METLVINGDFKGRNGWAKIHNIEIMESSINDNIIITANSRRIGHSSPLELNISRDDACKLAKAIEKVTYK